MKQDRDPEDYLGRVCLSRQKTLKAWQMERAKIPRWKVAAEMNVCEKTLYRAYKKYQKDIEELKKKC